MVESDAFDLEQPSKDAPGEDASRHFERTLPENCVEYMVFILGEDLEPRQIFSSLETVRKASVQLSNQLTKDYIWQRESFGLEIKSADGSSSLISGAPCTPTPLAHPFKSLVSRHDVLY